MRLYEGLMVFDPSLSLDSINDGLKTIEGFVEKKSGKIEKVISLGKKTLGYEVQKKKTGVMYLVYFNADASAISDLTRELRLFKDLLKFTIFRAEKVLEEPTREKKAEEVVAATAEASE